MRYGFRAMRYDLTSLKLFVAVAECGNLTRAAEREHLAVSAISKRVAERPRATIGLAGYSRAAAVSAEAASRPAAVLRKAARPRIKVRVNG